jgi:hypothetical protein
MKKKIGTVVLVIIIAVALGLPALPARAASIIYVDADATTGDNNGSSWEDAYTDLQTALANANDGDDIWVAAGTYTPGTARTDSFDLVDGVALYGGFAGNEISRDQRNWVLNETILSGEIGTDGNSYHVVTSTSTNAAILDGVTITGGNADGSSTGGNDRGGGIYNWNSSPTVTNCIFRDNSAFQGGGMQNDNSSPTVTDCTFEYNSSIYAGGGMYNNNSSPMVTNCKFENNSSNDGGGMQNYNSSPTVTGCIFSENSAGYGGGMYNLASSSPMVTNCVFSGNSADGGGGMYNNYPSPTVTNCILWDNSPDQIKNHNNSSPNVTYCDVQGGYTGDGNMGDMPDDDPKFADAASGDFHLLSDSPCIDKGTNFAPTLPDTDFDGDDRIIDGDNNGTATVDMGADEFVPETELITATIDIKPGSFPNSINPNNKGVIPVAILTTDDFDAATLDPVTVRFGPDEALPVHYALEDVDDDGDDDMILHFRTQDTGIGAGDTEATLTGKTIDGAYIIGTDSVRTVPPQGKGKGNNNSNSGQGNGQGNQGGNSNSGQGNGQGNQGGNLNPGQGNAKGGKGPK